MIDNLVNFIKPTQSTIYDTESLTTLESIGKVIKKVNNCINEFNNLEIKTTNEYNNFISEIKKYKEETQKIIESYKGDAESVINEFKELISSLGTIEEVTKYIKEQSEYVENLAQQNAEKIASATVVSKTELNAVDNKVNNNLNSINSINTFLGDTSSLMTLTRNLIGSLTETSINVKDYGAKGDGVTDDSEAFNKAIAHGNRIIIPVGKYVVTNIAINKPIILIGETSSFAWRKQDVAQTELINKGESDMFINKHWNDGGNSIHFENIVFTGNGKNNCIRARWDLSCFNCTFRKFNYGVYDVHGGNIISSKFYENTEGIRQITDVKIFMCDISKNEIGINMLDSNSNNIIGNRIEWNSQYGIKNDTGVFNSINCNQFDRNKIGIYFNNIMSVNICGNRFDRNTDYHISLRGSQLNIVGNTFYARNTEDNGSGEVKPKYAINLISYGNINFTGNTSNSEIFDTSQKEYSSGYFNYGDNYSPKVKTYYKKEGLVSGNVYIPFSDIGENVNGWGYDFKLRLINKENAVYYPKFNYGMYSGISFNIEGNSESYTLEIYLELIKAEIA